MKYDLTEARSRILKNYTDYLDLEVKPLTKETDLHGLGRKQARIVEGVHVYLQPANFNNLLEDAGQSVERLRSVLRLVHVYQRQLARLLNDFDGAFRVHFQGIRLHAVFYKPYDTTDVADPPRSRIAHANEFVAQARELCSLLSLETGHDLQIEAGIESGRAFATVNGQYGAGHLLFIGKPANTAAKLLTGTPGKTWYGPEAEEFRARLKEPAKLPNTWRTRVQEDVKSNPIARFETFEPQSPIDYERLGVRTADLNEPDPAMNFFADISGFTDHVASLVSEDDYRKALAGYHAARSEMHEVAVRQAEQDLIQYQGDRIQALGYAAKSNGRYPSKALEGAAAIQEAIDQCRKWLPGFDSLGMTTGLAAGRVLVTMAGIDGDREVVVLGGSVAEAAELQDGCAAGETAINARAHGMLPDHEQALFEKRGGRFVSRLDLKRLGAVRDAKVYSGGSVQVEAQASGNFRVVQAAGSTGIRPAKSYLAPNSKDKDGD